MEQSTRNKLRLFLEFLRLAGLSGLVFVSVLFFAGLILGWVYQDRIKALLLKTINESLQTEVLIDDIGLDIFRSFPQVSISMRGLTVMGSPNGIPADTLLYAQKAQLQFNPVDFFRSKYIVKQIVLSQGFLHPDIDDAGISNYQLIKSTGSANNPEVLQIDLQSVVLKKMHVLYRNLQQHHHLSALVKAGNISGSFTPGQMHLKIRSDMLADSLTAGTLTALRSVPVILDLDMRADSSFMINFTNSRINIDDNALLFRGMLHPQPGYTSVDMQISGKKLSITQLTDALPASWNTLADTYLAGGELEVHAAVKGTIAGGIWPAYTVDFSLDNGICTPYGHDFVLHDVQITGTWQSDGGEGHTNYSVLVSSAGARVNHTGTISAKGRYSQDQDPDIAFNASLDLPAADLAHLLQWQGIHGIEGQVSANFSFASPVNNSSRFTASELARAEMSGSITSRDLGFMLSGNHLKFYGLNGHIQLKHDNMVVESFSGHAGSSDFSVQGSVRNFMQYVLLKDQALFIDAKLLAENIDFDELLLSSAPGEEQAYRLQFSDKLSLHVDAQIKHIKFRRFEADKVSGTVSLLNKRLYADKIVFDAMDGRIQASGYIDGSGTDILQAGCQASLQHVDIHQLFYQMGNFGQTSLLDENIFGILTSDVQFSAAWSPNLQVHSESIKTMARIRIQDGVLADYEPMKALGRFIRTDDLSRVTFSTLENTIHILDRNIHIPHMEIQSNVLNLKLSGNHDFDNQIDYHMQVLLSDVLARKNRRQRNPQSQYGHIIDDGLGRTTLFLKVSGDLDNPSFAYDFQGVREKLADDFRQQAEDLRIAFGKEFNPGALDSGKPKERPKTEKQKEMERLRKQEQGKMILEWDD